MNGTEKQKLSTLQLVINQAPKIVITSVKEVLILIGCTLMIVKNTVRSSYAI